MAEKRTIKVDLGLNRPDHGTTRTAILELETSKGYSGGVESDATVFWYGNGGRQHAFALGGGGGDFTAKLHYDRTAKATQKAIDRQHDQVFTPQKIAELTEAAKAHYANQEKQSAA
jgi:hypothetical protein